MSQCVEREEEGSDRPESPTSSCVSMKSDRSKEKPPEPGPSHTQTKRPAKPTTDDEDWICRVCDYRNTAEDLRCRRSPCTMTKIISTSLDSITGLPLSAAYMRKFWHKYITQRDRVYHIRCLVCWCVLVSSEGVMSTGDPAEDINQVTDAQNIERNIYESANSKEQYNIQMYAKISKLMWKRRRKMGKMKSMSDEAAYRHLWDEKRSEMKEKLMRMGTGVHGGYGSGSSRASSGYGSGSSRGSSASGYGSGSSRGSSASGYGSGSSRGSSASGYGSGSSRGSSYYGYGSRSNKEPRVSDQIVAEVMVEGVGPSSTLSPGQLTRTQRRRLRRRHATERSDDQRQTPESPEHSNEPDSQTKSDDQRQTPESPEHNEPDSQTQSDDQRQTPESPEHNEPDSQTHWDSIRALPPCDANMRKSWHEYFTQRDRDIYVRRLVVDMSTRDPAEDIKDLVTDAQNIERNIYESVNSYSGYLKLILEKRSELEKKERKSMEMKQSMDQTSTPPLPPGDKVEEEDEEGGTEGESKKVEGQPDVKMEEKPEGTIHFHGEMEEHPGTESQSSLHPSLELQDETDLSSCFSGLWIEESISLPRSHSLPSLSQIPCLENKTSFRAKRSHSVNDVRLLDKTQKISPDIIVVENEESYRIHCNQAGLFQCNVTDLVFKMKTEGDVTYRTVHWDRGLLSQLGMKRPAGPLFDIKGFQGSVCQLHFPHCEILSMGGGKSLSVVHVMDDGHIELIKPHVITETHVIIDVTGLSLFGIITEMFYWPSPVQPSPVQTVQPSPVQTVQPCPVQTFQHSPVQNVPPSPVQTVQPSPVQTVQPSPVQTVQPSPVQHSPVQTRPVQALVSLFYAPPIDDNHPSSTLKVLLLPRNVVLDEVKNKRRKLVGEEIYIEKPPCKLIPNQEYTLSVSPEDDSIIIEPDRAIFEVDESSYHNFTSTFEVILDGRFKRVRLLLRDSSPPICAWKGYVDLLAAALRRQQVQRTVTRPADERLLSVRSSFVNSVSNSVLNNILDELLEKKVIIKEEYDTAYVEKVKQVKARVVIDTVTNKGTDASLIMIFILCETDPFLSKGLGLML